MTESSIRKLSPMELKIMEICWELKSAPIREIQAEMSKERQIEYTTVQTLVYRLEKKGALKRVKKIGNAHIFEPVLTQKSAIGSLIDEFMKLFGGSATPVMNHFIESGKVSAEDLKQYEAVLRRIEEKEKNQ